ncbi:MAG: hybrid sensor histidine kinase/response regulator [Caulobacteraceae bacterium]
MIWDRDHDFSAGPRAPRRPRAPIDGRLAPEQVAALFNNVTLGVLGAAAGAIVLAASLIHLGVLSLIRGAAWAGYVAACAGAHLLLRQAWLRATDADARWRRWGALFTAVSLAEGLGWGWATIFLVGFGRFDIEMLVLVVCFAIASGAIAAFSFYLPAFCVLFFPTTVPYLVWNAAAASPLRQSSAALMLVFVLAMGALGFMANRTFRELVGLRLTTHALAEDLRRQKEIAEEANLAKSRFLAAASHDLRQPVHALSLFVGALRECSLPIAAADIAARMEASVAAMDAMFGALLDISRLDAGVVEVHPVTFDLQAMLERLCGEYAHEADAKGVVLTCRPARAMAHTDPVLAERIVRNLVGNAVRHTRAGRVLVACRGRATARVEVWDTGPGIPADQRERVFEEYFQLENPQRDRAGGLGLGLAIVRRLADLLACPVAVRSWPGRGSCFSIDFPRAGAALATRREAPLEGVAARGLIAVIDDEPAIVAAMRALLTGWGHEVVAAGSGAEMAAALSAAGATPDLIVCDLRLPGEENGIAVIERLRATCGATIPAMLMTGDTAPERLLEAKASGLALLHKPLSPAKLRAAIGNLIDRSRPRRSDEGRLPGDHGRVGAVDPVQGPEQVGHMNLDRLPR